MPYILQSDRDRARYFPRTPGELNFAFTEIIQNYLRLKGINYTHLNDTIGALEGAKLELYRRIGSVYEQGKLERNGDVYAELFKETLEPRDHS